MKSFITFSAVLLISNIYWLWIKAELVAKWFFNLYPDSEITVSSGTWVFLAIRGLGIGLALVILYGSYLVVKRWHLISCRVRAFHTAINIAAQLAGALLFLSVLRSVLGLVVFDLEVLLVFSGSALVIVMSQIGNGKKGQDSAKANDV